MCTTSASALTTQEEKEKLDSRIAIKSLAWSAYNGNDLTTRGSDAACCQALL